jgi:hypothetical protein
MTPQTPQRTRIPAVHPLHRHVTAIGYNNGRYYLRTAAGRIVAADFDFLTNAARSITPAEALRGISDDQLLDFLIGACEAAGPCEPEIERGPHGCRVFSARAHERIQYVPPLDYFPFVKKFRSAHINRDCRIDATGLFLIVGDEARFTPGEAAALKKLPADRARAAVEARRREAEAQFELEKLSAETAMVLDEAAGVSA